MRQATTDLQRFFQSGLARAVAELGGDRAAQDASGVSKSVWYDAKSGRAVPDERSTWPAMREVLMRIPTARTGVRDWDALYELVCAERGRGRPHWRQQSPNARTMSHLARAAPQQLPPGTVPFVARDTELLTLDRAILSDERSIPIVVVAGPPGVGKTALALAWAHRTMRRFPDGVLYVDLCGWGPDRPMTAEEVLPAWLQAFGMDPAALPDDVPSRAAALRSVLAKRHVLLVLDNARSEEQVRPLLPGSPACAVLITSRYDMQGLAIHHGARTVSLGPLSVEASIGLLREIAGEAVAQNAETIGTLARLCGRLPLALRIVAEIARNRSVTAVTSLVAELNDEENRLDRLGSDDPRSDPRTVLSWSYRQLSPQVRGTFRLLGLFPGRAFDTSVVAALTGATQRQAATHLRALTRAHLVRLVTGSRFAMHDLIRVYAGELAASDRERERSSAARSRLFHYYMHTSQRADEWVAPHRYRLPLPGSTSVPAPFDTYEGALRWLDEECRTMVALCRHDEPSLAPLRWRLAFLLKSYFFLSKRTPEWLLSHEAALAAAIRAQDRSGEAMTHNNLGLAWHERGDDDQALLHYQAAERLFREVNDPHGVSNAIANQAVVHRRRGHLAKALELNERALRFYRRAAEDHPDSRRYVAITLRSIALVETEAQRYDESERHLRESLDICAELGMAMDGARAWNALGQVLLLAGRFDAAANAYGTAITASESCASRFEEAIARYGRGAVAVAAGDHEQAAQCWESALHLLQLLGSARADEVRADLHALRPSASDPAAADSPIKSRPLQSVPGASPG